MLQIEDSVAVITGAGGDIGLSLGIYWVKNGGKVLLADIDEKKLIKSREKIEKINGEAEMLACDVTNETECSRLADYAIEKFGKINLVAPFAGIIKDRLMVSSDKVTGKVIKKMALDDFQSVININLTGVFLTVRECAERMINNNCKGLICLISSIGALGTAGQINYSSTKAAVSVMPKVITAEFFRRGIASRIRCVAVAPGYVGTEMVKGMNQEALAKILDNVPLARLIEPEEVASFVGELYRNEALNGDVFYIHGGLRLGSKGNIIYIFTLI